MRRLPLPLLLAALLATAAPLGAQDAPAASARTAVRETAVVFSVHGRLRESAGPAALATDLVARLGRERALATLTIGPPSGAAGMMVARFVFADEAAFRAWYGRPETRETLREVEVALLRTEYGFTLKRYPAAGLAEAAQSTP